MSADPVDVMARTVWGEASGTGAAGMRHVAAVIMNRVHNPTVWGGDIVEVCLSPNQFQVWNTNSPALARITKVTVSDPWFLIALGIAHAAVAGKLVDETYGADAFFAISMKHPPSWTKRARHTYSDGWHSFWKILRVSQRSGRPDAPVHSVNTAEKDDATPKAIF